MFGGKFLMPLGSHLTQAAPGYAETLVSADELGEVPVLPEDLYHLR